MNDNCLYVYNLTKNVSADHLREIFTHFGNLKDIHFILNEEKGNDNNENDNFICAKLNFENDVDAKIAREFMNGGQIDGKTVSIKYEHAIYGKEKHKNRKHTESKHNKDYGERNEKRKGAKDNYRTSSSRSLASASSKAKSTSLEIKRGKRSSKMESKR
ncbi:RNA-binding protein s1, putative [Plasmodium ovale]|nr:RNA-binding protein s1, putative [Plasmodium ovale]